MVYNTCGQKRYAETYWMEALAARPEYWDAIDQIVTLLNTQKRQDDVLLFLFKTINSLNLNDMKETPHQWWKYLSLHHTLGETYSAKNMFYEAALTFSNLIALALNDDNITPDMLGVSQQVNQGPTTGISSTSFATNAEDGSQLFIPSLITQISRAVKLSEKHVIENTPAAPCDSTHRIFGNNNAAHFKEGGEANSSLFIIPLRHALLCKYYMFPTMGKLPSKANTPEWEKYKADIKVNNGIHIASITKPTKSATSSTKTNSTSESLNTFKDEVKTEKHSLSKQLPSPTSPQEKSKPNNSVTTLQVQQNSVDVVVSNALLNLAKIFQDGICSGIPTRILYLNGNVPTSYDILGLYMLSLSLNPSASTANNIGILLSSLSPEPGTNANANSNTGSKTSSSSSPSKGFFALTMQFYNFGLLLDKRNTHIYTNLGSLLRGQGQAKQAIEMYSKAVECNPTFNIALTNLASALRDQGQIDLSIHYYQKAVECSPDFIEAVSGLANSRSSVCDWKGRGSWGWEKVAVTSEGGLVCGRLDGWVSNVIGIVDKQIKEARRWGIGVIESEIKAFQEGQPSIITQVAQAIGGNSVNLRGTSPQAISTRNHWINIWTSLMNKKDEGTRIVELIEHATAVSQHRWYMDRLKGVEKDASNYPRPKIPSGLPIPLATTILPFHAFTIPFNASQVSQISQRTSIRITVSSLMQGWLPDNVFLPPPPPKPIEGISEKEKELEENNVGKLVVGYISSDFLDHPLAHLMQSVFGFHDRQRIHAIIYATTPSDNSSYRKKIETESHEFKDVSSWNTEQVLKEIQTDGVHILVNLNGFTRGARNDIFAVRPCPVQISLIGFAGSLGGGWCDYLLGDKYSIGYQKENDPEWVYREKIIYMPRSFFVCDHRQSALDSLAQRNKQAQTGEVPSTVSGKDGSESRRFRFLEHQPPAPKMPRVDNVVEERDDDNVSRKAGEADKSVCGSPVSNEKEQSLLLEQMLTTPGDLTWEMENKVRKEVRKILFPKLPQNAFLMGNLNQLYKIDPTTFMVWLQILSKLPHAYLWLLQFPKSGEENLKLAAMRWTNNDRSIVDRIIFTPIAEKSRHILRARACDVFVDTPECNAHTTAADVLWSGTPIVTFPRYKYKMCSRVAASVVAAALPNTQAGQAMAEQLIVGSDEEYQSRLCYFGGSSAGRTRLEEIRRTLFEQREISNFFDTQQWVRDVERGFRQAWRNWVASEKQHIYL